MFNRLPFGFSSSSEYFQKRMSQILEGLPGVLCQTDDILIYGTTEQVHDERSNVVLKRLQRAQLTLNADKCELKKRTIKFVGYIIGSNGVQTDPQKLSALSDMEPPIDVSGVRRILGVVNQLGKFTPTLSDYTKP